MPEYEVTMRWKFTLELLATAYALEGVLGIKCTVYRKLRFGDSC